MHEPRERDRERGRRGDARASGDERHGEMGNGGMGGEEYGGEDRFNGEGCQGGGVLFRKGGLAVEGCGRRVRRLGSMTAVVVGVRVVVDLNYVAD